MGVGGRGRVCRQQVAWCLEVPLFLAGYSQLRRCTLAAKVRGCGCEAQRHTHGPSHAMQSEALYGTGSLRPLHALNQCTTHSTHAQLLTEANPTHVGLVDPWATPPFLSQLPPTSHMAAR